MRDAHGGVDHPQVVVNLRDGADGRARGARGGFLLDGDRGGKAFDHVDFGAFHLIEKLARVGGERLHVTALAAIADTGRECVSDREAGNWTVLKQRRQWYPRASEGTIRL